ncbi:MAG: BatA domain-containing protein [Kiritimatiellae bacterium]|nr:BatA domain-containing protein [Kiritimatiellia bacterium]
MLFLHPFLLWGLLGISIPVVIHLFNRRNARAVEWGAMRFLLDSLMSRRRSLLLEELLLMAARCLICGCAVLAMVRPFVPAGSTFPWWLILPLGMIGITLFGMCFVLERYRGWQVIAGLLTLLCFAACVASIIFEDHLSSTKFTSGSERDIALVIDGSSSMTLTVEGSSNFKRAVDEARKLIEEVPRGAAFSVIVAGAVPDPLVPAPVTDRKYILDALERAIPVHGVLQVPDALAAAAASLVDGNHITKQIVLIGDGQSIGWQSDDLQRWSALSAAFDTLPSRPRVFVRNLGLPAGIRNLTVKDVTFSRPVVGTDRDVRINVTVANTGREAVTPRRILLHIGEGKELVNSAVGQMEPGTEQVISFMHRFTQAGAQVVRATVDVDDEMAPDDTMQRVIQITSTLSVLVVDDGRGSSLLERGGGFVALGLMPSVDGISDIRKLDLRTHRYLIRPELISGSKLGLKRSFDDYAVIVLADLDSLPDEVAARIASFVQAGGNLLVINGARSTPAFYNAWKLRDAFVLPSTLGDLMLSDNADDGERRSVIDTGTFQHPALAIFKEQGDLAESVVQCYRASGLRENSDGVQVAARLNTGAPFLVEHAFGKGRVIQSLIPFDRSAGNLVMRHSFLPLIHELTSYLAQPVVAELNIPPSRGAVIRLAAQSLTQMSGHGLLADYYKRHKDGNSVLTRVDPTLNFNWGEQAPAEGIGRDRFSVSWQGSFVPEVSGHYKFFAKADDRLSLRIGSLSINIKEGQQGFAEGDFQGGVRYPLKASFEEDSGLAYVQVEMEGPGINRVTLPEALLVPVRGDTESWSDAVDTQVQAPGDRTLFAKIRYGADGVSMRTDSPLMQGLYQVHVPAAAAQWLGHLAGSSDHFPLCVTENPEESQLDALTPDEGAAVGRQVDLTQTESFDDLQRALRGKTFGRELWRIPAMALLILLIAECFLTRWIAVQRRTS